MQLRFKMNLFKFYLFYIFLVFSFKIIKEINERKESFHTLLVVLAVGMLSFLDSWPLTSSFDNLIIPNFLDRLALTLGCRILFDPYISTLTTIDTYQIHFSNISF